jgi:hypothetical protein
MKNASEDQRYVTRAAAAGTELLAQVQRFNWLLLALLLAGSWYLASWPVAQSVLIGGILANASFFLLRRDINQFMDNFSRAGMNWTAVKKIEKVRFFLKFYGRLAVLAVILYLLISRISIDVIGLVIGLSSVMCSVVVVVLSKGSMLYSVQRIKGA